MIMTDKCLRVPYGLFQLVFHSFLIFIVTLWVTSYYLRDEWLSKWSDNKCKGYVIPFVSLFHPTETTTSNFKSCINEAMTPIIQAYAKRELDSKISSTISEQTKVNTELQNLKNDVKGAEDQSKKEVSELNTYYQRIRDIASYITLKMDHFFHKIGAIVWTIYFLLITQINTILLQIAMLYRTMALVNVLAITLGVLGSVSANIPIVILSSTLLALVADMNALQQAAEQKAYCCFDEDSMIMTLHGETPIKNIKINDVLKGGGVVSGTIIAMDVSLPMYQMSDNVLVRGDHLVYHEKKWKYVSDTQSKVVSNISRVHCLVTSNNCIPTRDHMFRDYEELCCQDIQCFIAKEIMNSLDNESFNLIPSRETGEKSNCLMTGTYVKMQNGFKEIQTVQIGDKTSTGIVTGVYVCDAKKVDWVSLNGIQMGGRVITKLQQGNWDKAYNLTQISCPTNDSSDNGYYGYHLITSDHIIELKDKMFVRDFIETDDNIVQNKVGSCILDLLNNSSAFCY
jgi:hypothetical protein